MDNKLIVIGIGSSAGGLEALQIIIRQLSDLENCTYIIAQHLSPTYKSMMVDLLGKITNISVVEAKNALKLKPKTIYICPEDTDIYVENGNLYLKNIEQYFSPKPSINYLFNSIATEYKQKAIGIILSGTGSDGAHGIRAIKAEGGLTIAQTPSSAKYDGMPQAAIETGKVDFIININELSNEITRIVNTINDSKTFNLNDKILEQIYNILFEEKKVDFSLYKKSTIIRRIERRIYALKLNSLLEYLDELKLRKEEISNLFQDILIGVTSFFRDQEAFDCLKSELIQLLKNKKEGDEIRIWCIGCSTGEEAYSVGIVLSEILNERISKYVIKIFATDIDNESLKIAREGLYLETSLLNFDKKLIQKYFTLRVNSFEVKKCIRELVVFSNHNIINDSPFLRQDLIVCRNLLIYFNQTFQNRFFPIIHYALKDNGLLFLGKSESIGNFTNLFNPINKSLKLFKAQYTGKKKSPKLYNYSYKPFIDEKMKPRKRDEELFENSIILSLKKYILNKCIVINSSNDIVFKKGEIPYIKFSDGKITHNIFKLIDKNISLELRNAINNANKTKKTSGTSYKLLDEYNGMTKFVKIIVTPIKDTKIDDWINILFFQTEEKGTIPGDITGEVVDDEIIFKLQDELNTTRDHLQNVIEELEYSYEKMQTLNEELQSSNEELQSSNEELETTNEEIQSTNEELQTAYSELRVLYQEKENRAKQLEDLTIKINKKSNEIKKQKEITEEIINTAPISIIMLNKTGNISYSNTKAQKFFNLSKKELLNKTYSSKDWQILNFKEESIPDHKLPFFIIKKNLLPIHNFKHIIILNNEKKYISMSASALFNIEGEFSGAILYIDTLTSNFNLENKLNIYKNCNLDSTTKEFIDFCELNMITLNSFIKNELNELNLLIDFKEDKSSNLSYIKEKIINISKEIQKKIDFFNSNLLSHEVFIKKEIETTFIEFSELLINNNIKIDINVNNTKIKIDKNKIKIMNYILIKLLLNIQYYENNEIIANISYSRNKLVLSIDNIKLTKYKQLIEDIIYSYNKNINFKIIINDNFEILTR